MQDCISVLTKVMLPCILPKSVFKTQLGLTLHYIKVLKGLIKIANNESTYFLIIICNSVAQKKTISKRQF